MTGFPSVLRAIAANPARLLILVLALFECLPACAQQGDTDINRFTMYTGFDWMNSPGLNLTQRGFDVDFGVTVRPWLAWF